MHDYMHEHMYCKVRKMGQFQSQSNFIFFRIFVFGLMKTKLVEVHQPIIIIMID